MNLRIKRLIEEFKFFSYDTSIDNNIKYNNFENYIKSLVNKDNIIVFKNNEIDNYILENNIQFKGKCNCHENDTKGFDDDDSIISIFLNSIFRSNNPLFSLIVYWIPRYKIDYYYLKYDNVFNKENTIISTLMFFMMRKFDDNGHYHFTLHMCSDDINTEKIVPYVEEDYNMALLISEVKKLSMDIFGEDMLQIYEESLSKLRFNTIFDNKCSVKIRKEDFLIGINSFKICYISQEDYEKFDFALDDECCLSILANQSYNEFVFRYIFDNNKLNDESFFLISS